MLTLLTGTAIPKKFSSSTFYCLRAVYTFGFYFYSKNQHRFAALGKSMLSGPGMPAPLGVRAL
nr:MAG TPA: hypothetical protein [Caudoviricetes sp.]